MNKRTCSLPECVKPIRARGLCSTHYNAAHQPSRHAKKLVNCAWCGIEVLKQSGGGRKHGHTCSNECRQYLQTPYSKLPTDHWSLWFGKASAWPRARQPYPVLPAINCAHCGDPFTPKSAQAKYCSSQCTWRWHDRNNGVRSQADIMADRRDCARCGTAYNHTSPQRMHCTDLCRDLARSERGTPIYHGWIAESVRVSIYERDKYTCWLCGNEVDMNADPQRGDWSPSLDHVIARSHGGTHDVDNLRTAHRWCNAVRGDSDPSELFSTLMLTA